MARSLSHTQRHAVEAAYLRFLTQVPPGTLWVFGYGSLMWSPDFPNTAAHPALLRGYHRALCIYSTHYRGTPQRPGLVLGLRSGGACHGIAFRVHRADAKEALRTLWDREMLNLVYQPRFVPVTLRGDDSVHGQRVHALTFTANPDHTQFAHGLSLEQTAQLVAQGRGKRGANITYVDNTLQHMQVLGVQDHKLTHVLQRAKTLRRRLSTRVETD